DRLAGVSDEELDRLDRARGLGPAEQLQERPAAHGLVAVLRERAEDLDVVDAGPELVGADAAVRVGVLQERPQAGHRPFGGAGAPTRGSVAVGAGWRGRPGPRGPAWAKSGWRSAEARRPEAIVSRSYMRVERGQSSRA